jgi:hypothetical protein
MDNDNIAKMLESFEKNSKALRNTILKLIWYMRGSITLEEGFTMSFADREMINSIVKENIETTQKTGLPFF